MALKICVYAISKNEEQFVERFCEAAKDADLILIADTGSTDNTKRRIYEWGSLAPTNIAVADISIKPWRFDHARNAALALIPDDVDVCVSLDLDEVLQPGWRAEIERVWVEGTTRMRYLFDWGLGIAFYYEKIHARHGYYWHHPCHEYPMPDGRITENWATSNMLLVVHRPDNTKDRRGYLDLLKLSVEEDPHCPRNAFYYARQLSFESRWDDAILACQRYLALPRATWPSERCYAYRVIGRCHNELGQPEEAYKAFLQAASEAPETREPWYELSKLMHSQRRWHECFAFAMRTLRITDREKVYTVDPEVWSGAPHDLLSVSAWWIGLKDLSWEHAKKAHELSPADDRMRGNLLLINELMTGSA